MGAILTVIGKDRVGINCWGIVQGIYTFKVYLWF